MTSEFDRYFMSLALREAEKAAADGEVPTGCVIVEPAPAEGGREGEFDPDPCTARILARAHNQPEMLKDATAHAEMLALRRAAKMLGRRRLSGCVMYVTLEPCPMCAGAIAMSGIDAVYYGASDEKAGCAGSLYALPEDAAFGKVIPCTGGLMEEPCRVLLDTFFEAKRG